jgi:hypothetical protein
VYQEPACSASQRSPVGPITSSIRAVLRSTCSRLRAASARLSGQEARDDFAAARDSERGTLFDLFQVSAQLLPDQNRDLPHTLGGTLRRTALMMLERFETASRGKGRTARSGALCARSGAIGQHRLRSIT